MTARWYICASQLKTIYVRLFFLSRKQPGTSTVRLEAHETSSDPASARSSVIKSARLHRVFSQSFRAPSSRSQSTSSLSRGAVYRWTLTANPMAASGAVARDKAMPQNVTPAGSRSWNSHVVGPSEARDKYLPGRGWAGEPAAVHRSGRAASKALPV